MECVRCTSTVCGWIGQWLDDLELFDDRAGPAVRDDDREGVLGANDNRIRLCSRPPSFTRPTCVSSQPRRWERHGHFFAAAALAMRRILVERARHYQRIKHGGGAEHVEVNEELAGADPELTDVIAIEEALTRLEATDPRKAKVVTLRYFAGLSVEETAGALNVSPATVKNEWMFARAWLFRVLRSPGAPPASLNDPADQSS
jgi:RNA polymerase sigma factor (sigma-70 family)